MNSDRSVRGLLAAAAVAACVALAGCNAEQVAFVTNAKANKPIPQKLMLREVGVYGPD